MTRINVRTKGAVGEREAAALLQKVVDEVYTKCGYEPPKLRRNIEQSQVGGEDLVGLPWYSFEIKRVERVDLDKWWKQTCIQASRKAPLASTAEAQRLGGWKALAAEVGSVPRASCGAVVAGRVEVGSAGSLETAVRPVAGLGQGMGGPAWAGGQGTATGHGANEQCLFVGGLVAYSQVIPLPLWARASGLVLAPSANGGPVDRLALVGGPSPVLDGGGLRDGQGRQVSSPLAGGSPLAATLDASKGPNAEKPLPMARKAVLLWRQNARPWQVRFLGTLVAHNEQRLVSVVDTSLETWIRIFRADLESLVNPNWQ